MKRGTEGGNPEARGWVAKFLGRGGSPDQGRFVTTGRQLDVRPRGGGFVVHVPEEFRRRPPVVVVNQTAEKATDPKIPGPQATAAADIQARTGTDGQPVQELQALQEQGRRQRELIKSVVSEAAPDHPQALEAPDDLHYLSADASPEEVNGRLRALEVDGVADADEGEVLKDLPKDATEKQVIARLRELGLDNTTEDDDVAQERRERIEGITPSALKVLRDITARHHVSITTDEAQLAQELDLASRQERVSEALTTLEARQDRVAGYVTDQVGAEERADAKDYRKVFEAFMLMREESGGKEIVDDRMLRYLAERQLEVALGDRDEAASATGVGREAWRQVGITVATGIPGMVIDASTPVGKAIVGADFLWVAYRGYKAFRAAGSNFKDQDDALREKEIEVDRARLQLGLEPIYLDKIAKEDSERQEREQHPLTSLVTELRIRRNPHQALVFHHMATAEYRTAQLDGNEAVMRSAQRNILTPDQQERALRGLHRREELVQRRAYLREQRNRQR